MYGSKGITGIVVAGAAMLPQVLLQSFPKEYRSPSLTFGLCWDPHQNFNFSRHRKSEERSVSSVLFVYSSNSLHALNRG